MIYKKKIRFFVNNFVNIKKLNNFFKKKDVFSFSKYSIFRTDKMKAIKKGKKTILSYYSSK